jgi:hypothetical protein
VYTLRLLRTRCSPVEAVIRSLVPTPSAVLFPDDSGTIPAIFLPEVVSLRANNEGQWTPSAHAEVIALPLLCLFVSLGQT